MKIPYNWVRELVDVKLSAEDAADRLVNAGLEVAGVTPIAPELKGVVVGEIEAIEREIGESQGHRLVLCRVTTGAARFPVVCGAPNAAVGVRAAFAPPGATLPGGHAIGVAKIRGFESHGMLCSERELGLGEEHEAGLLTVDGAPLGADLVAHLGLDERVLEIEITPNRPDCLSILGVARGWRRPTSARATPCASSAACAWARRPRGWPPACARAGSGPSATWWTSPTTCCGSWAIRCTPSTPTA